MLRSRYLLHAGLFVVTLLSTALTGAVVFIGRTAAWSAGDPFFSLAGLPITGAFLADAFTFAGALIGFLTVHEFGHYIAARIHGVRTSLPYFIPAPLIGIGTLGAVIRIREPIQTPRKLFDVGASGPLAGFVLVLGLLLWAMASLPSPEYMFGVGGHDALHRYIEVTGRFPDTPISDAPPGSRLTVGATPLYWVLSKAFAHVPPAYEMYHYPLLFAAWLGLFFTALNLMPVGQLDGGHITYALFGPRWHGRIARVFMFGMLTSMAVGGTTTLPRFMEVLFSQDWAIALTSWITLFAVVAVCVQRSFGAHWPWAMAGILGVAGVSTLIPDAFAGFGYFGWLPWCLLLVFLVRVDHPPVPQAGRLTGRRRILGYCTLAIFVLCFSIRPLYTA